MNALRHAAQFVSGEMHYVRVPREAWRDRLRMARAMGLHAVSTYAFWNVHEERPGTYDFSTWRDIAAYVREARDEGLAVILRPGPYVCAEWEFGGLPAWLLREPDAAPRTRDERFLVPARAWLKRLGEELAPLQSTHGGPIVAVQVENEYGSFGDDAAYMRAIADALADAGFDRSLFYTADIGDRLARGTLPDVPCAVNFGAGTAREELAKLAAFRPGAVPMCGEYWAGWFDHWGEQHHVVDARRCAEELAWMLERGCSVNIYLFAGGTNFGGMNGANDFDNEPYQPTTTSYDYDAPLDEAGRPTEKYYAFREVIARRFARELPAVPTEPRTMESASFSLDEHADWRSLLTQAVHSAQPLHLEAFGAAYGYALYRHTFAETFEGTVQVADVRDFGVVMLDGRVVGMLDRRLSQRRINLAAKAGSTLEVLVENSGRMNFGERFTLDRKGLIGPVNAGDAQLRGWEQVALPMRDLRALTFERAAIAGPAFHRGSFVADQIADTFLDTSELGKGLLWVNGRCAGRFWEIGPQHALYIPASFVHRGVNEVVAFDLFQRERRAVSCRRPFRR